MVRLCFTSLDGAVLAVTSSADGRVVGLREATTYRIEVNCATSRLVVDDVELPAALAGHYTWVADFYAGEVVAVVIDSTGQEYSYRLDVCPHPAKLGAAQYAAMLDDIRAFDTSLLLGPTAAALGFGREGRHSRWEPLVLLARLRQHGPAFLAAVQGIVRSPHWFLRAAERPLNLRHVRRIHPTALLDRRLAALVHGGSTDDEGMQSLQLRSSTPVPTVDTPANRALKALLQRFLATTLSLAEVIERNGLKLETSAQELRRGRRLEALRALARCANGLLKAPPFVDITGVGTSAAGLTQMAAHPRYARAYRLGTQALRVATGGAEHDDQLPVSPSWGVYETWCFIAVARVLEQFVDGSLSVARSPLASADLALTGRLSDGRVVELLFQGVFPSEEPFRHSLAWSVSRERRPDIVLAVADGPVRRWLVLDAKYRSGRDNVLDAMTSAHVYRDALRLGKTRPERSLLLLPGVAAVSSLEADDFWREHHVGTLSEFVMSGPGLARISDFIAEWIQAGKVREM